MTGLLLLPAAKPRKLSPVPLGRPSFKEIKLGHGLSLFCQLLPKLPAGFRFAVKRLRDGRRAAYLAQLQDFHLKLAAVISDLQQVTHAHFTGWFGLLSIGTDAAQLTGPRGERARLEEAGGPKPFVHANASHEVSYTRGSQPFS